MSTHVLAIAAMFAPWVAFAQHGADEPMDKASTHMNIDMRREPPRDEVRDRRMKVIGSDLACLCGTCPRRDVASCDCGWAAHQRKFISLAILEGRSDAEIVEGYLAAYGLKGRVTPPDTGFGRMSYVVPYVGMAIALIIVILLGMHLRRRSARTEVAAQPAAASSGVSTSDREDEERRARDRLRAELDDLDA